MDADSFNDLALRALSREATDDERRTLEAELSSSPARREEFEQLRLARAILRTVAPMTEAARATEPELPLHRMNELHTAVRQHFGPAVNRRKASGLWIPGLRWIFAGGGATTLAVIVIFLGFSNRSIEVGLYGTGLVRGESTALSSADVPGGQLVTFNGDAAFDQWQNRPLAWYERAKIWIDDEHDLLHIVRREKDGRIAVETQPLASTNESQREQIRQVVEALKN